MSPIYTGVDEMTQEDEFNLTEIAKLTVSENLNSP